MKILLQQLFAGIFLTAIALSSATSAASPEFRGAWVASVYNLDWPSKPGLSPATQQAELLALLDLAKELKLTAILLQIRPASDALYQSKSEPWSAFLTGHQGTSPGYDPLSFAIHAAHARGLQLHAWFNPFRAAVHAKDSLAPNHIARLHPEWIRNYAGQLWLDPGIPAARRYVLDVILDVVRRYPIDGVHIDDYFYPYPKGSAEFPDAPTWTKYGDGGNRSDWRRSNINHFVKDLYHSVKSLNPNILVGISPFGIWKPGVPATIEAGLDSYGELFADSRKWLAEGWCDYLAPQLYWSCEPAKQSFPVLLAWWRSQSTAGKPIWPGLATERIGKNRPASEIIRQINLSRKGTNQPGHIHWNMKALLRNQGGINSLLKNEAYR